MDVPLQIIHAIPPFITPTTLTILHILHEQDLDVLRQLASVIGEAQYLAWITRESRLWGGECIRLVNNSYINLMDIP